MISATETKQNSLPRFLDPDWTKHLNPEFSKPELKNLGHFLQNERIQGKEIYPNPDLYFAALNLTPFQRVKVVILGQDPYHGLGQAHGLSFSVPKGIAPPPSLKNIFKELQQDLGVSSPKTGDLSSWTKEGVLLLNSVLSVEKQRPASHQKKGWEHFTDRIIEVLNANSPPLVFMLWGRFAVEKKILINNPSHLVLEAPHPSPFSAYKGFFGCRHFSRANEFLTKKGRGPVLWSLP